MTVILAIDAGTTGVRTLAVDESGRIISSAYKEFTQYFPEPGLVEHDAEEIWNSVQATLADVVAKITDPIAANPGNSGKASIVGNDGAAGKVTDDGAFTLVESL